MQGVGISFSDIELASIKSRRKIEIIISNIMKNKNNWIYSGNACLYWSNQEWHVNLLTEDDIIEHRFDEDEIFKAIEQLAEHSLSEVIGGTDEEAAFYQ
jgi:hypothetical protein